MGQLQLERRVQPGRGREAPVLDPKDVVHRITSAAEPGTVLPMLVSDVGLRKKYVRLEHCVVSKTRTRLDW